MLILFGLFFETLIAIMTIYTVISIISYYEIKYLDYLPQGFRDFFRLHASYDKRYILLADFSIHEAYILDVKHDFTGAPTLAVVDSQEFGTFEVAPIRVAEDYATAEALRAYYNRELAPRDANQVLNYINNFTEPRF